MSDDIQRMLGAHEAQIAEMRQWRGDFEARIDRRLTTIESKLEAIHTSVTSAKGGWRMLIMLGGLAGAIGAGVATVYHWLHG